MSGLSYLTCVKLNWPISNLRSESERKYLERTRTIADSPPLARALAIRKQNSLFAGYRHPGAFPVLHPQWFCLR